MKLNTIASIAFLISAPISACGESSLGNAYGSCETDADCDGPNPECRTFQLHGRTANWCTRACDVPEDCPTGPSHGLIRAHATCVPVGADGTLLFGEYGSGLCAYTCDPTREAECPLEGSSCVSATDPETGAANVCVSE